MCNETKCTRGFNVMAIDVRESKAVTIDKECNGFVAINKGDTLARVNGIILQPAPGAGLSGESFAITGEANEFFTGGIQVTFESVASNPLIQLVQKYKTV